MIYPRLSYRLIALMTLYMLLVLGVVGAIFLIFPINGSEIDFLFKSEMIRKHTNNSVNWKYRKYPEHNNNGTKIPIVPTQKYILNNPVTDEIDQQQHIYIDDFYSANTKPKPIYATEASKAIEDREENEDKSDYSIGSRKQFNTDIKRQRAHTKLELKNDWNFDYFVKKPTRVHFDDDSDENKSFQQNDNVASGSGDGSSQFDVFNSNRNDVLDSETQEFIKRISRKWLKLSKKPNSTVPHAKQTNLKKYKAKMMNRYEETTKSNRPIKLPTPYPSLQLSKLPTLPDQSGDTWQRQIVSPFWKTSQIRTRRIIANEKKSAERSRQLLLCTKGNLGGGELCRMLFKET